MYWNPKKDANLHTPSCFLRNQHTFTETAWYITYCGFSKSIQDRIDFDALTGLWCIMDVAYYSYVQIYLFRQKLMDTKCQIVCLYFTTEYTEITSARPWKLGWELQMLGRKLGAWCDAVVCFAFCYCTLRYKSKQHSCCLVCENCLCWLIFHAFWGLSISDIFTP